MKSDAPYSFIVRVFGALMAEYPHGTHVIVTGVDPCAARPHVPYFVQRTNGSAHFLNLMAHDMDALVFEATAKPDRTLRVETKDIVVLAMLTDIVDPRTGNRLNVTDPNARRLGGPQ